MNPLLSDLPKGPEPDRADALARQPDRIHGRTDDSGGGAESPGRWVDVAPRIPECEPLMQDGLIPVTIVQHEVAGSGP